MPTEFNDNSITGGNEGNKKQILLGRVTKVILSEFTPKGGIDPDFANQGGWGSIGSVKYNLFTEPGNPGGEIKTNNFAKPLFPNFKSFPLVGELVALLPGPSTQMNDNLGAQDYYYLPAYNLWNSQHHNAFPDLVEYAKYAATNTTNEQKSQGAKTSQGSNLLGFPLGFFFKEKKKVNTILPFEGDIIFEGRNGQAIRFGSTSKENKNYNTWSKAGKSGDPITIITNRRADRKGPEGYIPTVEDINKDGSSIWLASGQSVNINVSMYPLDTFRLGFQATYNADSVLPLVDLSPGIQNIASAEYDKRVLDRITDVPPSKTTFRETANPTQGGTIQDRIDLPPTEPIDRGDTGEGSTLEDTISENPSNESDNNNSGGGGGSNSGGGGGGGGLNRDENGN